MTESTAAELANDLYKAMTGPGADPMPVASREALKAGLALASIAVDALERIAEAMEAHSPARPSDDPHNAL